MSQLITLGEREHRTLRAINDVLYPAGGAIPYSANQVGVCEYVDDYVYHLKPKQRRLIRLLLLFLEFAPQLLLRSRRRLSRMNVEERTAFLEWMEASRFYFLRIVLISIRTIVGMGFMADVRVQRAMGMFSTCNYPNDPRKPPSWREIPGAEKVVAEEVRHAG